MPIDALTAYAHVADVRRSVEFYRQLGLEVRSSHESDGKLVWALVAGTARAWLARSPRRLAALGGTGGLVMIGLGATLALTGRKD